MSDVDIEEKEFAQKEKDQEFFQKLDKFVEPIMKIKTLYERSSEDYQEIVADAEEAERADYEKDLDLPY